MAETVVRYGNGVQTKFFVPGNISRVVYVGGILVTPASTTAETITLSVAPGMGVPVEIDYETSIPVVQSGTGGGLGAVNLVGSPSNGQVPIASGPTAAAWGTPNFSPTGSTFAATVINQVDTLANLLALSGNQGQLAVPSDSTGVVRFTGVAGGAQHLTSGASVNVIDASAFPVGLTQVTVGIRDSRVHVMFGVAASTVNVQLNFPVSPSYGQEISVSADAGGGYVVMYCNGLQVVSGEPLARGNTFTYRFFKPKSASAAAWNMIRSEFTGSNQYANFKRTTVLLGGADRVESTDCIVMGAGANVIGATSQSAIAIGYLASSKAQNCVAVGYGADAASYGSLALGGNAVATGESAVAFGADTSSTGIGSTAVGSYANAVLDGDVAIGYTAVAGGGHSVAIGEEATTEQPRSVSIGFHAKAQTANSLCVGVGPYNSFSVVSLSQSYISGTTPTQLTVDEEVVVPGNRYGNLWYVLSYEGRNYQQALYEADVTILGTTMGDASRSYRANKRFCFLVDEYNTISIVGAIVDTSTPLLVNCTAPTVSIAADNANGSINISITLGSGAEGTWTYRAFAKVLG